MNSLGMTMNGGEGPNSYFQNSKIQAEGLNLAKDLLRNGIEESLEVSKDSKIFSIADLGCSVGPNTFSSVKNIIEAVQENLIRSHGTDLEFQVFFNDHVNNDFNTLFKSLPADRNYMAAGVPGSFQNRLFPRSSINMIHSSFALQWLTKIPQEITEETSPLWNKGRITYARSSTQIVEAFRSQFFRDIEAFFKARSEELTPGGLLAILMPFRVDGTEPSDSIIVHMLECLGDALADMVNEGLISRSLFNCFNVPFFVPTVSEVKEIVSKFKYLKTERFEELLLQRPKLDTSEQRMFFVMHIRSMMEETLCQHFGPNLIDEIFDRCPEKLEKYSEVQCNNIFTGSEKIDGNLFLLVKRNDLGF